MADAAEEVRRAQHRTQDQLGKLLSRGRRPTRSVHIPVLEVDPPFESGINLWMDPDGNLRSWAPGGTKYQYAKTAVTAASGTLPADPQPVTVVTTYTAQWAASYCDVHGQETGNPGLWYGDAPDASHLGRRIMIGLDDATIRTDTNGATIDKVELSATNLDAYSDTVTLYWGLHNVTGSAPASFSAMRAGAFIDQWPRTGTGNKWRNVHTAFGMWLRDNQAKGLTVDQSDGSGNGGQIDWTSVKIRITYTK